MCGCKKAMPTDDQCLTHVCAELQFCSEVEETHLDTSDCIFPWIYKGVPQESICSEEDSPGSPWCATSVDSKNNYDGYSYKYCREKSVSREECIDACEGLPSVNTASCMCNGTVCQSSYDEIFCDFDATDSNSRDPGCRKLESFSNCSHHDDYNDDKSIELFTDDSFCFCNFELMNTKTDYCYLDSIVPLPGECGPMPGVANSSGCVCYDQFVCSEHLMCDNESLAMSGQTGVSGAGPVICRERPPPCPHLPQVAGFEGCYCDLSHEICSEGESCGGVNGSCYDPARCLHPESLDDWSEHNAVLANISVETDDDDMLIEATSLMFHCLPHHYVDDWMDLDNFTESFSAQCGGDGNWTDLFQCSHPTCEDLQYDDSTVEEQIYGEVDDTSSQVLEDSIVKLSCMDEGNSIKDSSESRAFFYCHQKKWQVLNPEQCPDKSTSCVHPVKVVCSFQGCSVPEHLQDDTVTFQHSLEKVKKDSVVSARCSSEDDEYETMIMSYDDPDEVLVVEQIEYEPSYPEDNGFCPHEQCTNTSDVEWIDRDGFIGKGCVEDGQGEAFCVIPDGLKWDTDYFSFDGE